MSPRKLIGVRDPQGFRPLCLGKRDSAYIFASESCALDTIGAEFIRDVEPGEIVTVTKEGQILSNKEMCQPAGKHSRVFLSTFIFPVRTVSAMVSVFISPD